MFVTLENVCEQPRGILAGILGKLLKPRPELSMREAFGARYGVITVHEPVRGGDWSRVFDLAGRLAGRMLIPEGTQPPEAYVYPRFPRFERQLLLNTALAIISLTRMPMYRRILGLVDLKGEYADFLFPLLHYFTAVKALTAKAALYHVYAEKMMYELGAPVIIAKDYESLSDCVLILAPGGAEASWKPVCPVMCPKPPETRRYGDYITGLKPDLDAAMIKCVPTGINPYEFFAALYEYCGAAPAGLVAGSLTWRNSRAGLDKVAGAVAKVAGMESWQSKK